MSKSTELHEEQLSEKTHNIHRAIISLIEELEAIDWYTQRVEACQDAQLQAVRSIIAMRRSSMHR
jgi:hypothetical protein